MRWPSWPSGARSANWGPATTPPGGSSGPRDRPRHGCPGYQCARQEHSYLLPQPEPDPGQLNQVTEELIDYASAERG
jgi:hypothetical protein